MSSPAGYSPIEVNSTGASFASTKFNRTFIQENRRSCGIVLVDSAALGGASAPGFDALGHPMSGTAVLIDYNYILMCNHTFKSLMSGVGPTAMKNGQVTIVFFNEYTSGSVDTAAPVLETTRPFAKLRGDVEAWTGTNDDTCKEDFALVKIEWNSGADYPKVGKMAKLPDPATFAASSLTGKKLCTLMQYSSRRPVRTISKTAFTTHVAMGPVTAIGQSPPVDECTSGKDSIYVYVSHLATTGSSGGGVYDENGILIGLVDGGVQTRSGFQTFVLPLDAIYKCKQSSYGREAGQKLKDIYNYRKANEKW